MSLNWNNLRPWNGSQRLAFEELCCQLAGSEDVPSGVTFVRKGAPDAGVECYWKLSNTDENAWQAKYFTSPPNDSQWRQIDDSVKTALEKHPKLTKYTICLPIDRQDPRIDKQNWFMDKWNQHEEEWKQWAKQEGMLVEFPYWGQHEIGTRLALDKHSGRRFFWFNEEYLSQDWLEKNLDIALKDAGPRYTPALNVELPVSKVFDALGRSNEHRVELKRLIGRIKRGHAKTSSKTAMEYALKELEELGSNLQKCTANLNVLSDSPITVWGTDNAEGTCRAVLDSLNKVRQKLEEGGKKLKSQEEDKSKNIKQDFDYELHNLRELEITFYNLLNSVEDPSFQVSNRPSLLVSGNSGTGKTHLFCDIANKRITDGVPTVLLLGQHFVSGDPWSQIIIQLGLPTSTSRDMLLGALEAAAQASGNRALIMIDALNESENRKIWLDNLAGILALLRNFPWVGIAISVRKSYQDVVVPNNLIGNEITLIEHKGFGDCGYEAIKIFFRHYHIQLPSVPFLEPEFYNPLFLKTFCEGLQKKGEHKIPTGLKGVTRLFKFFLDAINEKLAKDNSCYDPKLELVQKTAYGLAAKMARSSVEWLTYNEADNLVRTIWPHETHTMLPLRTLISESLLSVDRFLTQNGNRVEGVKFCYQRFSDHMIAEYLLGKHCIKKYCRSVAKDGAEKDKVSTLIRNIALKYNKFKLERALKPSKPLGQLIKDEYSCWAHSGLVEALSVQIPEFIGCELVDLAQRISEYEYVQTAFLDSLVWRDPRFITDNTLEYINNHIIPSYTHMQFLETLLTLAPLPYHPYNADFLHKHLMKQGLANRDSWWSTFLYYQYNEKGPIDRLIDWCWSKEDKQHISDDSVKLCAKSLCWFFTTSQRCIRDRATKALVSLLTGRIHIMRELLNEFNDVDDPYVLERLYASAYGCAMRSKSKEGVTELAIDAYNLIFKNGAPPANISLRGCARNLVELGVYYNSSLDIDVNKCRPPYHSVWPENIPPIDEVKAKYEIPYHDEMTDEERGQNRIVFSVLDWDFARYIIGTNVGYSNWSSRRLGVPREPTNREIYDTFFASLGPQQKEAWEKLEKIKNRVMHFSVRKADGLKLSISWEPSASKVLQEALSLAEQRFFDTLDYKKKEEFENVIKDFVEDSRLLNARDFFDLSIAQAFILERVFSLGWNKDLHGKFDFQVSRYGPVSRTSHKPERMGKKYQWIAYRELLARVSDNFEYVGGITGEGREYKGTWQLSDTRDIDPSCILKKTGYEGWGVHERTWWFPYEYTAWDEPAEDVEWLKQTKDLPDFSSLIEVLDHKKDEWIVLTGYYNMEQPTPPEEDRYELERRTMWYSIQSYVVRKDDIEKIFGWAKQQDFWGDWMPKSHDVDIFLGEFFWSPAFKYFADPYYGQSGWSKGDAERRGMPCDVLVTTTSYSSHMSGYDCSIDEDFRICLPAKELVQEMNLCWVGYEGEWCDAQDNLIAFDPSVQEDGPGCMLIKKDRLLSYLNEKGYDIIWTIIGAKRMLGDSISSRHHFKGELKINGTARLKDGDILIHRSLSFSKT